MRYDLLPEKPEAGHRLLHMWPGSVATAENHIVDANFFFQALNLLDDLFGCSQKEVGPDVLKLEIFPPFFSRSAIPCHSSSLPGKLEK